MTIRINLNNSNSYARVKIAYMMIYVHQPINAVPIRSASISLLHFIYYIQYECHLNAGQRRPGPKALIVKTPWKDISLKLN